MRSLIMAFAMLTCTSSYALKVDMKIDINQKVTFTYKDKTNVEKLHTLVTATGVGIVQEGDLIEEINRTSPPQLMEGQPMSLSKIDKNNLRLIDAEDGINQAVPAKIKSTLGGTIKAITIKGEDYEAIYNAQLSFLGIALFGSYGIDTNELGAGFDLNLSDLVCKKKDDNLICDQTMTFTLKFTDEFVGSEKLTEIIDNALSITNGYIDGIDSNTNYGTDSYIEVLDEIHDAIKTEGIMSEFYAVKKSLSKIKDYIFKDKLDSYKYRTIQGSTAKSILNEIKAGLENAKSKL